MTRPFIGHGVGLRVPHYERALAGRLGVDWVEVVTENFFGAGGRPRAVLEAVRREVPLVFHGVSLGIGSSDGPQQSYLARVKALADAFEPAWLSDHLCWTGLGGQFAHELLPLPYTEEALDVVVRNVWRVQDFLGRPIALENVSSYVGFHASQMPEWEFLSEVASRAGCFILLDLNNIIVSAHNNGFLPLQYLEAIPGSKVWQLHLANHSQLPTHKFDDHRGAVPPDVWALFEAAIRRFGPVSSLVEWDEDVPSWERLVREQREACTRAHQVLGLSLPLEEGLAARSWSSPRERPAVAVLAACSILESTQRLFFQALTWPTGTESFLAAAGPETRRAFELTFSESEAFDKIARVDVYANAYFYRLLSTLRELFPRFVFLIGDARFHNLVTDYVLACPSREPDLRRLGDHLPGFLRAHELVERWPVLFPLVMLECALNRALDCADSERLAERELADVPIERWPGLRLAFQASVERIEARHDLVALGELCDRGQRDAALGLTTEARTLAVLVWRHGHRVYFRRLGADEDRAVQGFVAGASFAQVCADLLRLDSNFQPASMLSHLQRWLADDIIAGFSLDT